MNLVFQGASALTLDSKGRMVIPARHRGPLEALCQGQLTVTKHPAACLLVFPTPAWKIFSDKVVALPMSASGWKRVFLGNAVDVEIDSAERVLVPPELRAYAGLDKHIRLMGMGNHFELWDSARYDAHEAEVMAHGMPDVLADFTY